MLKSIITKIVGGILIFLGALILLAGLTEMFGDPGFFLFCLVFAALLIFPAVVLIRWGSREKPANPYAYNPGGYPYQPYAGAPQPHSTDPQATTTVTPVVTPQQPQRPQQPLRRHRTVSKALRAYAQSVSSADKGGVRIIEE